MALMDEFREEREKIKNGTLKEKASYFWEYYKWYVIIPAIIIVFLGTTIYQKVTEPETILNGILLNTYNEHSDASSREVIDAFSKQQKIDTKEYEVSLNTSLTFDSDNPSNTTNSDTIQALVAWLAAGTVDFICTDINSSTDFAYNGYFIDLREILSKEEIQKYEPYFLYIDTATSKALEKALDDYMDDSSVPIPESSKPETMEDPVPVMIDLSKNEKLSKIYANADSLAIGIATNAPNKDMLLAFLDFLVEK